MAQTVTQGFQELSRRLEITDYQSTTVSTCHTNIRDTIKKEMTVLDDFLTGSYIRNTMIAPLSQADIDIFIVLHSSYFKQDGQRAILDKVKGILQDKYTTTTQISRNGQAVTMYLSNIEIDVVPAFQREGGGYLIPDSTLGQWMIFHIFGALAEFERDIIRERTNAGLKAARARGRFGGRPKAPTLNTQKKVAMAQSLYDTKTTTIEEICTTFNISRSTLYRYIKTK